MAAPTPVSAYLHSATMVRGSALFEYVVTVVGLATFVIGAYAAIFKHDLKGLLAYSTISHLGLIVFLFKASLFMAAGIIDHEAGTRDTRRLAGLWRFMPYTASLAIIAAAAMAGVPLLNGFLSKEMFFTDRILALDTLYINAVAFIILLGLRTGSVAYFEAALDRALWLRRHRGAGALRGARRRHRLKEAP